MSRLEPGRTHKSSIQLMVQDRAGIGLSHDIASAADFCSALSEAYNGAIAAPMS